MLRGFRAGPSKLASRHAALARVAPNMSLVSTWFKDGRFIPPAAARWYRGNNLSPPLCWSEPPRDTIELALLIEDPDAPSFRPAVHLIVYGISPEIRSVPAGAFSAHSAFGRFGINTFDHVGYSGPAPLPGHGAHTYHFHILALCRPLAFERPPKLDVFLSASRGAVVGRGCLTGRFRA